MRAIMSKLPYRTTGKLARFTFPYKKGFVLHGSALANISAGTHECTQSKIRGYDIWVSVGNLLDANASTFKLNHFGTRWYQA